MTAANEFIPDIDDEDEVSGPVILGVPITSKVIGIAIGLVGVILFGVGIFKVVIPAWEYQQMLNSDIQTKQREIEDQNERLQQQEEAERKLEEARQRRLNVTALFADEANLETLMFDINEQLNQINAGIADDEKKVRLIRFLPGETQIVDDGSLGSEVNGKLRRREYDVEVEGSFEQIRRFLMVIERMQPMLVVRSFDSRLIERSPEVMGEYRQGQFVAIDEQPQRRLTTGFKLHALMPLSQEQLEAQLKEDEEAEEAEEAEK